MEKFIATLIYFFAVIDPIGSVPVFISVTNGYSDVHKKEIAYRAILVSAIILVAFVLIGEFVLKAVDIPIPAFQIAGGIVLFLFALSMIFGESKPEEEKKMEGGSDVSVFPLAMPSIASPAAILAAVLFTENAQYSIWEQALTVLAILLVLGITLKFLLLSNRIYHFIGEAGAGIISRIMGLILTSVAVTQVLMGIQEFFK